MPDAEGKTPLHWAANTRDPSAVATLKAILVREDRFLSVPRVVIGATKIVHVVYPFTFTLELNFKCVQSSRSLFGLELDEPDLILLVYCRIILRVS